MNKKKQIVIWWAGPAWLTLAYELLSRSDAFEVIVLERFDRVWGISTTIDHHGNKMDIWWHRFFSKSKRVMDWRFDMMPLQWSLSYDYKKIWLQSKLSSNWPDPDKDNFVMLSRRRLSRIYWNKKFFDYPLTISFDTIKNLWFFETIKIWLSYISSRFKKFDTSNLEWFYKSRFGEELYNKFFKNYTYNVRWVYPKDIPSERWAQRVKWLSLTKAIWDYFKKLFNHNKQSTDTETSLIWSFYYPKYGPWQMRDIVADKVLWLWWTIIKWAEIVWSKIENNNITEITYIKDDKKTILQPDYFVSTLAIKDLLTNMEDADLEIVWLSNQLMYRDFVTVWVLLDKLAIINDGRFDAIWDMIPDNWIYIHDDRLKVGRIQIFNNRSPYMVTSDDVWIWLEYFCDEDTDKIYNSKDEDIINMVKNELSILWFTDDSTEYKDFKIVRYDKTYPSYFGEWYKYFTIIRKYLDDVSNLFLIWRNGMHRYNNQDHSMLCAMQLADMLLQWKVDKSTLRDINTERVYHEENKS